MLIVRHARLGIDRGLRNQREALTGTTERSVINCIFGITR